MSRPPAENGPHVETTSSPLVITLFGPIQVLVNGQPLPRLRSRKALWLLALLTLRHDRLVERSWLAGTLWPDADQEQAFASMRVVLSELRKALGDQGDRLRSPDRHTLSLDTTGADVDVLAFDAAVVRKTPGALAEIVALYRGPLLEGCTEEWAPQERRAREEDCLRALQTLADNSLAAGDYGKAAEYFQRTVEIDPWRDAVRRGLMEALSRGGDTNAALQVYREFTELLRADPKAVPDKETSDLYARLRTEARRQVSPSPVTTVEDPAPAVTGYLPHPLTDLVGREDERLEVSARLRRARLVTLTGPGGIGKTRLAVEVAGDAAPEFADGVWLVSLEALADEARLDGQIAGVLGLKETPGQSWRESLTHHLRTQRLLLVLDNCEHLHTACAQVVAHLLQECARVRILATSREALGVTGETVWAVPALTVPDLDHLPLGRATLARVLAGYDSVQLLVERTQAVQKTFSLTGENAPAVAQICARLEGMPLAIELAAARINVLTLSEIAARLDDHLGLLAGGSRTGPSRQQTLRATLDWSYSLLSDLEQTLLRRLSVFAGGWGLTAAESVCVGDGLAAARVLDLLASLVDKSLVVFESRGVEGRYRFLETVRQYAAEQLDACQETGAVRARHSAWAAAFVEVVEPELSGATKEKSLRRLDAEYDNMRAALEFSLADFQGPETGLRIATVLRHFWDYRGRSIEGREYLGRALARQDPALRTPVRAKALLAMSILSYILSEHKTANELAEEGLVIYRALGDRKGIASCLHRQGSVEFERGNLAAAQALHEECLSIQRELGNTVGVASSVFSLGMIFQMRGDFALAGRSFEENVAIDRARGDVRDLAWSLYQLAMTRRSQGALPEVKALIEESLGIFRELGDQRGVAYLVLYLGDLAFAEGEFAASRSYFEESLRVARELNEKRPVSWALYNLGRVLVRLDDRASAEPLIEESLSLFRQTEDRRGEARATRLLGQSAHSAGDHASAQKLLRQSLKMLAEIGEVESLAPALNALASVIYAQSGVVDAVRLWGAIDAQRERIGESMTPLATREWERQIAEARTALPQNAFTAAWAEGRALTWEQAAAYALEE